MVRDLSLGGNSGIIEKAESYFSGSALTGVQTDEIGAVRFAFKQAARYATAAMRNWTTGNYVGVTPSTATYDATNGNLTVTIPTPTQGVPTTTDRIAFVQDALNWSCTYNGTPGEHAGPSRTDPTLGKSFPITNVSTSGGSSVISCNVGDAGAGASSPHTFVSAITNGTIIVYDTVDVSSDIPKFEDWTILIDPGAAPLQLLTPTTATYDPANGDFTITTSSSHGLSTNEALRLAPESFVFTCAMDNNRSEHYLPAVNQPAYGNTLAITGVTSNTITVDVGASAADQQFTPTDASYDPATGLLDLTIGTHNLGIGEGVILDNGAVSFKCAMDNFDSIKSYPRSSGDPYAGRSMPIVSSTDTTITVNVGQSPANKYFQPTAANYNHLNGDLRLSIGQHGLRAGGNIVLENNSLTFTCDMDGNATEHYLPQSGQTAYGNSLAVTGTTSDTFTVNVGASDPDQQWTPTDATYNPATGELELTVGAGHNMSPGFGIIIDDNSLSFKCTMDGNDSTKTYPRPNHDRYSGRSVNITAVSTNTITVNVGQSPPDKPFKPTDAVYDPVSGDMVVTIGQHGLGVGKHIKLGAGGLSFTCDMDDHQSVHSYPRSSDPQFGKSVEITGVGLSQHTVSNAVYDAGLGKITLTVTNHPFINGDFVKLLDNSLTFNCALDRAIGNHTYVGGSASNIYYTGVDAGGALAGASAGTTYDPLTGELVIQASNANNTSNKNYN